MLTVFTPDVLILIAGGLFTLGYLIINQVVLRLMIMAGSVAYIAYYATAADEPLWGAIYSSLIMMGANALGLIALYVRNARWTVPRPHRDIYDLFAPLPPGDFRRLMRLATRYKTTQPQVVTTLGEPTDTVYFVINGTFEAEKFNLRFQMTGPTFVGEVAYLMGKVSAATTHFPKDLEVIAWDRAMLNRAARKDPSLKLALEAVMSRDLAHKVALAVAPGVR